MVGDGSYTYDPDDQFESLNVGDTATDTFTYTAVDASGNTSTQTVTITINGVNDAPEVTPPGIADLTIATSAPQATVDLFDHFQDVDDADNTLTYTVTGNTNPSLIQPGAIASVNGELVPDTPCTLIGNSIITVTAEDSGGLSVSDTFTVTVIDDVKPVISCGKDHVINAAAGGTAFADFSGVTAWDKVDPAPVLVCNPDDSAAFAIGSHTIVCTATDASGNIETATFQLHVLEIQEVELARTAELIGLRNDPAPGAGTAGVPAGATIRVHNRGYINNDGDVIYEASLTDAGTANSAVFTNIGGVDTPIGAKNTPAPGGANFGLFKHLAIGETGATIFQSGTGSSTAQFTESGGAAALVAQVGLPAPGTTGEFRTLHQPAINFAGEHLAPAHLAIGIGGVVVGDDTGIWHSAGGGTLLGREGSASPIGSTDYGQFQARVVAAEQTDFVAFSTFLVEPVFDSSTNTAIFSGPVSGPLSEAVREGDATGIPGVVFAGFQGESINNNGELAFRATLRGTGVDSTNNDSLWSNVGGSLQMIAREGGVVPCLPTTDVAFSRIKTVFVSDDGTVCFYSFLKDAGGVPAVHSGNDGSIWRWSPALGLHLVAREGDMANNTDSAVYRTLSDFDCNNTGGLVFHSTLVPGIAGVTTATEEGLWLDQGVPDVAPLLVLRRGDNLTISGLEHLVTSIELDAQSNAGGGTGGYGRALNDSGEVLLKLSLNRNVSGLFKIGMAP